MWKVSLRLSAVLPMTLVPWVAASGGSFDPVGAGFLMAAACVAGRSSIRYVRIRLR